jgi:hypothetical protein
MELALNTIDWFMGYWLAMMAITVLGTGITHHWIVGFAVMPRQAIKRFDI